MFKKIQKSRKGSALLIGLIITTLLSILVIGFLDKVLRVGKNTKAIEQSTQAYYLATGIIENKLRANKNLKKEPWKIEGKDDVFSSYSGQKLIAHTGSSTIPATWKGNSPFGNADYNIISLDKPVQIVIPEWINWENVDFDFRIPTMEGYSWNIEKPSSRSGVILWTLGNTEKVLFASGGVFPNTWLFLEQDIGNIWKINNQNWYFYNVSWVQEWKSFKNFYSDNLGDECQDFKCTLKLSMLQSIKAKTGQNQIVKEIPFLEYKITFNKDIPEQFMTLEATGKVSNYQRMREVQIPQITTNTALDFAVLQ